MYHMNLQGRVLSEPCSRCREPSVLFQRYSGRHLCATHLAADILIRTKRTIRIQGGLGKKPVLSIIWDGSARYLLLYILGCIVGNRPNMEFVILHINSGCNHQDSPSNQVPLPSGITIREEYLQYEHITEVVTSSGSDRIVQACTLDDEAEQVLSSLLSGDCCSLICSDQTFPVPCLTPLREIPYTELMMVADYWGVPIQEKKGEESDIRKIVTDLTNNHPSLPFSLLNYRDRLCELGKNQI